MDAGEPCPTRRSSAVEDRFTGDFLKRGFVLDGFPRTLPQAEELERVLDGKPLDLVIDLEVPTEIVLRRIAGRRACDGCGTTYHVDMPPSTEGVCDARRSCRAA